jgi:hypothetical protein
VATTPWKPITAEQVLGDRTSGFKKYIWVIVKDEFENGYFFQFHYQAYLVYLIINYLEKQRDPQQLR